MRRASLKPKSPAWNVRVPVISSISETVRDTPLTPWRAEFGYFVLSVMAVLRNKFNPFSHSSSLYKTLFPTGSTFFLSNEHQFEQSRDCGLQVMSFGLQEKEWDWDAVRNMCILYSPPVRHIALFYRTVLAEKGASLRRYLHNPCHNALIDTVFIRLTESGLGAVMGLRSLSGIWEPPEGSFGDPSGRLLATSEWKWGDVQIFPIERKRIYNS